VLALLAETGSLPFDPQALGVIGVVLVLALFGWVEFKPGVMRLVKDKERAEAQRDALVETWSREVFPVLAAVNQTLIPALNANVEGLRRVERALERMEDRTEAPAARRTRRTE
jgi:hypothetical protein